MRGPTKQPQQENIMKQVVVLDNATSIEIIGPLRANDPNGPAIFAGRRYTLIEVKSSSGEVVELHAYHAGGLVELPVFELPF
jgi:hypothetical protein